MGLFGKNRNRNLTLVFDIGNASIGAALVNFEINEQPIIVYTSRIPIGFQQTINAKRFLSAATTTLETLCVKVQNEYIKIHGSTNKIKQVVCTFASPWLFSKPIAIHYQQEKKISITPEFIEHLILEERNRFMSSFIKEGKLPSVKLIETRITSIVLNGYNITRIADQRGTDVTIHTFFSAAATEALQAFEKVIHTVFHINNIFFSSFLFAYFNAVQDMYEQHENIICIDVTGEVTDILVTNRGTIANVSSFPSGTRTIARTIANSTGIPGDSALALQNLVTKEGGAKDPRVEVSLRKAMDDWITAMNESLHTISTGTLLPRHLFVTIDTDVAPPFLEALKNLEYDAFGISKERFIVTQITEELGARALTYNTGIPVDPFLTIDALFVKKLLSKNKGLSTEESFVGVC